MANMHLQKFNVGKGSALNTSLEKQQAISGRVDRASATGTVDSGSIPSQVKPKDQKNWYSLLYDQQLEKQCEPLVR